jgi:hypothetical protein
MAEFKKFTRADDPRWDLRSSRLFAFLEVPRTWEDLDGFAIRERLFTDEIREELAYLEMEGLIDSRGSGSKLVWRMITTGFSIKTRRRKGTADRSAASSL